MRNFRLIDAERLFEKVGHVKPKNKKHYEAIGEFMNMITNSETVIIVEELPDVVNKIYIAPKEIFDEYGEVKETVYEEWVFTANKIGEVSGDEFTKYKSEE